LGGNRFSNKAEQVLQRWVGHGNLLQTGTVPLAHFKVHLCGEQGAGKTMLRKAIARVSDTYFTGIGKCKEAVAKDEPKKVSERTVGMEMISTTLGGIELCLCDYGGQPEFHFQHSWFMPSLNGLYIIVVNSMLPSNEQKQQVCYWLRFIQACCAGSAHVALVGSRADSVANRADTHQGLRRLENEIYKELGSEIPNLTLSRVVFTADCRRAKDTGTNALKVWLHQHCKQELAQMGMLRMPKICQDLRIKLSRLRAAQPVMHWREYEKWVKQTLNHASLSLSLILEASIYLHDFGEIVFIDKGLLKNWVFLEPSVLCEKILGKLLCPKWISGKPPLPVCSTAKEVAEYIEWNTCNANPAVLIQLLQEFGVCLSLSSAQQEDGKQKEEEDATDEEQVYFFPAFLPEPGLGSHTNSLIVNSPHSLLTPLTRVSLLCYTTLCTMQFLHTGGYQLHRNDAASDVSGHFATKAVFLSGSGRDCSFISSSAWRCQSCAILCS
jgi:hypothetical protein